MFFMFIPFGWDKYIYIYLPHDILILAPNANGSAIVGADDRRAVRTKGTCPHGFAVLLEQYVRFAAVGKVPQDDRAVHRCRC